MFTYHDIAAGHSCGDARRLESDFFHRDPERVKQSRWQRIEEGVGGVSTFTLVNSRYREPCHKTTRGEKPSATQRESRDAPSSNASNPNGRRRGRERVSDCSMLARRFQYFPALPASRFPRLERDHDNDPTSFGTRDRTTSRSVRTESPIVQLTTKADGPKFAENTPL